MRLRGAWHMLLIALLCVQVSALAETPKAWGYLGWWLPESWRSVPLEKFDRLQFFELQVAADGSVEPRHGWPDEWPELRQAIRESGTPLDLTLTLLDSPTFEKLFASDASAQYLLEQCMSLVAHEDVAGLQLDFEVYTVVEMTTLARYQKFVRTLAQQLHQQQPVKNLSIFFPLGGKSVLYDAVTLTDVDQVVLQGYDAHWTGSKTAGPVAPLSGKDALTWEKAVAEALKLGVPKSRLILGFPLFGYEWRVLRHAPRSSTLGKGASTTFAPVEHLLLPDIPVNVRDRVKQYGASHDAVSGSSSYRFKLSNGRYVEGWFEDWWALERKTDYLIDQQLGGIAFFLLGYDQGELTDHFFRQRARQDQSMRINSILEDTGMLN